MADENEFLVQTYLFFKDFLLKGVIAVAVLLIATFIAKRSSKKDHKRPLDETNFCSSPNCLRCSKMFKTSTGIVSEKLVEFSSTRADNSGLERLYKGMRCKESLESDSDHLSGQRPTVLFVSGVSSRVWYNQHDFKYGLRSLSLPRNYELIKSEFEEINENLAQGWLRNTTPEGEWLVFHLFDQGEKVLENCACCPNTVGIIESIGPFIKGCAFGNALFSVLKPGTHITPHYGPTNCRIRCHLPLFVPEGCFLCVNDEKRQWNEKELLLFDDSFLHEAKHTGLKGERIILMLDLWQPQLSLIEKEALCFVFPSFSRL